MGDPSRGALRLSVDALARRFPKLEAWEQGERHPTLKQLERFAKATFTPVGFLFLEEPPVERVSIPDKFLFRRDKPLQSSRASNWRHWMNCSASVVGVGVRRRP